MLNNFMSEWEKALIEKKEIGHYRYPTLFDERQGKYLLYQGRSLINFATNDYLGLGVQIDSHDWPVSFSSSSSQLVSGSTTLMSEVEKEFADYFGYETALFFPSGFLANYALISTLFHSDDVVMMDKRVHASMVAGAKASQAQLQLFNHNDMLHLQQRLFNLLKLLKTGEEHRVAVLTESLYSMDGDLLDKQSLENLSHGPTPFLSLVDEAHAFGVLGEKGKGWANDVSDIAIGTLGKAFGFHGAFLLMPALVKEYLLNFCPALIYTTALPPRFFLTARLRLKQIAKMDEERKRLDDFSFWSKNYLNQRGIKCEGMAHILSLPIGEEKKAMMIAEKLMSDGLYILPARYPTVPLGKSILRLGLTVLHQKEDIKYLADRLELYRDEK